MVRPAEDEVLDPSPRDEVRPGDLLRAWQDHSVRLEIDVVDAEGTPVPGVSVEVSRQQVISDGRGRASLIVKGLSRIDPEVDEPWVLLESSDLRLSGQPVTQLLLVVGPTCPGPLRLLGDDEQPVEGVLVWAGVPGVGGHASGKTDPRGRVWLDRRPCGRVQVGFNGDVAGMRHEPATIEGSEEVVLRVLPWQQAELVVVGPDGAPGWTRDLDSARTEVRELEPGRYRLSTRRPTLGLWLEAEGAARQRVRVALDGGLHRVQLTPAREVVVALVGPAGASEDVTRVSCDDTDCDGAGSEYRCLCDPAATMIFIGREEAPSRRTALRPGDHRVEIDLGPPAEIGGEWLGPLPCSVEVRPAVGVAFAAACDLDGGFTVEAEPGATSLSVGHGGFERIQLSLELEAGQALDLGELLPSDNDLTLVVESPVDLAGCWFTAQPGGYLPLGPDQSATLVGMPPPPGVVDLSMYSREWGLFSTRLPYSAAGQTLSWAIDPADAQHRQDRLDDVDTGSFDTGSFDTGSFDTGSFDILRPWLEDTG